MNPGQPATSSTTQFPTFDIATVDASRRDCRDRPSHREAFEENQVRISATTAYLGYQEVRQPGRPVILQLRMAGIITEFAARAPDPDNGRLNRRYMTSLAAAPAVLGWGQPAEAQARAAAEAGRRWGLPVDHPAAAGYED